jgi:serine/threonine-protein kinase RsbT
LTRRHPSDIQDGKLLAVLDKYVPPIIGRSILERARREAVSGPDVSWTDPNGLLDRISVGVRLFAEPEEQAAILREVTDLAVADREETPPSHRLDGGPASSMKPSSASQPRLREEPPTRREQAIATAPPSRLDEGAPGRLTAANPAAISPKRETGPSWTSAAPPTTTQTGTFTSQAGSFTSQAGASTAQAGASTSQAGSTSYSAGLPPTSPAAGSASASSASYAEHLPPSRRDPEPARRAAEGPAVNRGVFSTSGPRPPASSGGGSSAGRVQIVRGTGTPPAGVGRVPSTMRDAASPGAKAQGILPRAPGRVEITHTSVPKAPGIPSRADISVALPRSQQSDAGPKEVTVTLATEHDIPLARQVAREICEHLGTRALTQQRLLTIVSELGRNMVLYAGGGKITLRPPTAKSRRIVVVAVDQGPGIPNLAEIMAGKYKSRSGLGLGLLGTKRLADSFNVETGRTGTTVSVEVIL